MCKKKLSAIVLASVLFVFLAGCGNSGNETAGTIDGEPVTIKWALWDWDATTYYQPLIDAYTAGHPNVTIEYTDLGATDYMNMLQTQLAGGADFDVVCIKDIPGYVNLVNQGQLEPLGNYIDSEGIDPDAYGGTVEQIMVEDEVYQLPFRSDFWVIYYNKDIFDEMGVEYPGNDLTLEEYDALARSLVSGEGNDTVYGAHYHTWRSAVQLFGILDGENTIIDGTYNWLQPYYEMVLSQQDDGIVMDYATATSTNSHYRDLFQNGKIAMMNMGTWNIATHIEAVANGETKETNWGVVKYPHPEGVEAGTTLGTITGMSVSKNSGNKEAALDFLSWVTGEEGAKVIASTGTIPAIQTTDIMSAITSMDGYPQDQNSIDAMEATHIFLEMPLHELSSDIEVILNEEHTEIMTGSKTIEQGLADMESRVGEILR